MLKTYISFILFLLSSQLPGQSNSWEFFLNTNDDRRIDDILEGEQDNLYFIGYTKEEPNEYNGFIYKTDHYGNILDSSFIINTDSSTIIRSILKDNSEGYILGVKTLSKTSEHNNCGFHLMHIDTELNTTYRSKNYLFPTEYYDIEITIDYGRNNNIIVFGYIFPGYYSPRALVYELNLTFDSIRANIYLDDGPILPMKIKQLNNLNFWVIGELYSKYILIDSMLNIIDKWDIPHYMNGSYGVKWDSDTSFFLAGDLHTNPPTDHDIGFLHQKYPFDTTGFYFNNWGSFDTTDYPAFWGALDYKNKDSIFIGGTKNINIHNLNFSPSPSWYVLLQTDSMLNIRWERFYGGDAYYNMTKLIATNDGGCIMAGTRFDYLEHPNIHERDIFILKVDAEGLIVSAEGKPSELMHEALVFPNPGSSYLRVRVAAQYKQSTFMLYDISGKQVLSQQITGKWAEVNTTFLKTGTYIYKIYNNEGLFERGKWVKR
jgi:hypothetical protein